MFENMLFEVQSISDARGTIYIVEQGQQLPFDVKRCYFIKELSSQPRGFHAHKTLRQLAVLVQGSCDFIMDDGSTKNNITLNSPKQALLIDTFVWHEMHNFSEDCILMVLASDVYLEEDYIRNYDEFLITVKQG